MSVLRAAAGQAGQDMDGEGRGAIKTGMEIRVRVMSSGGPEPPTRLGTSAVAGGIWQCKGSQSDGKGPQWL